MPPKSNPQSKSSDDDKSTTAPASSGEQTPVVDGSPAKAMAPVLWMGLFLLAVILWEVFKGK